MTEEKNFYESKEYHLQTDIMQEDSGIVTIVTWKIEIDLPKPEKQIKVSGSALTVDSARKIINNTIIFLLIQRLKPNE